MSLATRIPVLMYHRVGQPHDPREARYAIAPKIFNAHLRALAEAGYHAVAIDQVVDWLEGGAPLAEGAFLLTFDDGFRSVRDHAAPLLEALGWPYTVFLVSDLIGAEDVWTRATRPDGATHPLLDGAEIGDMQARGCDFHSHSRSHASLPALNDAELASQLLGSRQALVELLGREVRYLAYPFGHVDERVERAARAAGYRAAFATQPGFNRQDVNRFQIHRLDILGTDTPANLLRKVRLGSNDGSLLGQLGYVAARLSARLGLRR
ncbi:MAG: polysaccharide deacetylase family protein [Pseudomonadota bacterium]|nr:polysaccharide deacetylase family protein [Pseudomonadota bacterium]